MGSEGETLEMLVGLGVSDCQLWGEKGGKLGRGRDQFQADKLNCEIGWEDNGEWKQQVGIEGAKYDVCVNARVCLLFYIFKMIPFCCVDAA